MDPKRTVHISGVICGAGVRVQTFDLVRVINPLRQRSPGVTEPQTSSKVVSSFT